MSRPLRIEFENAWYHVMNRGAAHKTIYHTKRHYQLFLELLEQIHKKFKIEIHAYCLMSNHYHLMLRTPLANLQRAMRHLNGIYTQRFNQNQKQDGPLFRGRYKAIIVDDENYLLQLARYIHLNPVSAKICAKPEDFEWSSYSFYVSERKKYPWLFTEELLSHFNNSKLEYKLFTLEGVDKETFDFYEKKRKIPILGADKFIRRIAGKYLQKKQIEREIPEQKMVQKFVIPTVKEIIQIVAHYYGVNIAKINLTRRGKENKPRSIAIYLAVENCQLTYADIAAEFKHISHVGISNAYRKTHKKINTHSDLRNEINFILSILQSKQKLDQGAT